MFRKARANLSQRSSTSFLSYKKKTKLFQASDKKQKKINICVCACTTQKDITKGP